MEFLLLRKPKPQPPKPEQEVTFTGTVKFHKISSYCFILKFDNVS